MEETNLKSIIVYFSGVTAFRIFNCIDKNSIKQNQQYLTFTMFFKKNGKLGDGEKMKFMNDKIDGWKCFK